MIRTIAAAIAAFALVSFAANAEEAAAKADTTTTTTTTKTEKKHHAKKDHKGMKKSENTKNPDVAPAVK